MGLRDKAGQPIGKLRERSQRRVKHPQIAEERHERPQAHLPAQHVSAADVPHDPPAELEDQPHDRIERVDAQIHVSPAGLEIIAGLLKTIFLAAFLAERFDHAHAGEHAVEHPGLFARCVPEPVVTRIDVAPKDDAPGNHQRSRDEREHRQLDVDAEHHHANQHHHHDLKQKSARELRNESLQ